MKKKEANEPQKGHVTWITGRGGSGKSTLAKELAPLYDLVLGSDTGYPHPETGIWQEPTPEEKLAIRKKRAEDIVAAKAAGKRVLFEGAPGPVAKYPVDLFSSIDEIRALDVPRERLLQNVIARSKARGSWDDPVARADDLANFEALYNNYDDGLKLVRAHTKAPFISVRPSYLDKEEKSMKKSAGLFSSDVLEGFYNTLVKTGARRRPVARRVFFQDMPVSIEFDAGETRKGKNHETVMKNAYGYLRGTKAPDGDEVDVYLGKNEQATEVYVVNQMKPDGKTYDEDKVILGANSIEDAKAIYLKHMPSKMMGPVFALPLDDFKRAMMVSWRMPQRLKETSGRKRTPKTRPSLEWDRVASKLNK